MRELTPRQKQILTLLQNYSVDLVKIQGSTKDEIALLLGEPTKIESQAGSCECDKIYYLNNLSELT